MLFVHVEVCAIYSDRPDAANRPGELTVTQTCCNKLIVLALLKISGLLLAFWSAVISEWQRKNMSDMEIGCMTNSLADKNHRLL